MDVNPFDPDSVTVDLEVTAPSGKTVHVHHNGYKQALWPGALLIGHADTVVNGQFLNDDLIH